MAEPTLNLLVSDFQAQTGLFLGYGTAASGWDANQSAAITSIVQSGLRQFYFPPPVSQNAVVYDWSFLKPYVSLDVPSGVQQIALPHDFGGMEGWVTATLPGSAGDSVPWKIRIFSDGMLKQKYAENPGITGRPIMVAQSPRKVSTGGMAPQNDLLIYPKSDTEYTFALQYYINPDYLTGTTPYAYGGAEHAETILESCLAIAEQRLDDASSVHTAKFMERLATSVSMDRRKKPQVLGYNGDASDDRQRRSGADRRSWSPITVNGVQY